MPDSTPGQRRAAVTIRAAFTALVEQGFSDDQAVALTPLLVDAPPGTGRDDRRALVESLLTGQKPPATRSPADDRTAHLWNPPAPAPPSEGAPAHDH